MPITTLMPVFKKPTAVRSIQLSSFNVDENKVPPYVVALLSVSGATGTPVFAEVADPDNKFTIVGNELRLNNTIDWETKTSHSYTISVSGVAPAVSNRTVTILVNNINEDTTPPTFTSSANINVDEFVTLAHTLTADEPVSFTIQAGGADNAKFELFGANVLRFLSNGTKDFANPDDADLNNVYIVRIRATDGGGNTTDQDINVTINDVAPSGGTSGQSVGLLLAITLP